MGNSQNKPCDTVTNNVTEETKEVINTVHTNAVDKLNEELKKSKNKEYAKMIIDYLIGRCKEDAGFGDDVLRKEKTFDGCFSYIKDKARSKAVNGCAAIKDETVYEWAEDYYRSESTKVVAKSTKKSTNKSAETEHKSTEMEDKSTDKSTTQSTNTPTETVSEENDAAKTQRKKTRSSVKRSEPDGQMSIFDLMMGE